MMTRMKILMRVTTMSLKMIDMEKVKDLLSKERYGCTYKELCSARQMIIEELIRGCN